MSNLLTRTISGVIFMILMVCGIYFSEFGFAALFLFLLVMGQWEFNRMSIEHGYFVMPKTLTTIAGALLFTMVFLWMRFDINPSFILLSFIPIMVAMVVSLYEKDKSAYASIANTYASMLYVSVPLTIANFLVFSDGVYNGVLLLCFFGLIWGSDVGAYCLGCTLGKNGKKMFPSISPKKSWWGFAGGLMTAIIISLVLHFTHVFTFGLVHSVVLAILINVASVFGDLVESVWKRYYGVKDSGKIIPGHGGILDRFDSTLFAVPVGTIYLLCFSLL